MEWRKNCEAATYEHPGRVGGACWTRQVLRPASTSCGRGGGDLRGLRHGCRYLEREGAEMHLEHIHSCLGVSSIL